MLVFGVYVLNVHFIGNALLLLGVAMLGTTVFLARSVSRSPVWTEDQVPPMANALTLPMLLLSGVFFSRSNLPEVVRSITGLPLTHLADAMRAVAIDGAGVADILPQLIGLGIWAPVSIGLRVVVPLGIMSMNTIHHKKAAVKTLYLFALLMLVSAAALGQYPVRAVRSPEWAARCTASGQVGTHDSVSGHFIMSVRRTNRPTGRASPTSSSI